MSRSRLSCSTAFARELAGDETIVAGRRSQHGEALALSQEGLVTCPQNREEVENGLASLFLPSSN